MSYLLKKLPALQIWNGRLSKAHPVLKEWLVGNPGSYKQVPGRINLAKLLDIFH
jgi:hypothetical protein